MLLCAGMKQRFSKVLDSKWQLLAWFFLLIVLLYCRAYDSGFVTDFTGLYEKMQGEGVASALNSFGFPSLMPLLNLAYLGLYTFFGLNGLGWFLFFAFVFAVTATKFYELACKLLSDHGYEQARWLALITVIVIITSPYQVEAMIWKVGLGHLMSVCFLLMASKASLLFLTSGRRSDFFKMILFLSFSLLCFEWGLIFPGIVIVLGITYWQLGKVRIRRIAEAAVASVVVLLFYLLVTKLVVGEWLGHYDMETEMDLNVTGMLSTTLKYFMKHIGLVHFMPNETKSVLYGLAHSEIAIVIVYGVILLLGLMWLIRRIVAKKNSLVIAILIVSLICLVPVSGLFFTDLQLSENDRYGSLFVYFFSLFFVLMISRMPSVLKTILLFLFVAAQLYFQQGLVSRWRDSQKMIDSLTTSFRALDYRETDKILILNLPENMDGVFMFRDYGDMEPYTDYLEMYLDAVPEVEVVAQYNVLYGGQTFTARRKDDQITVESDKWGSWWWQQGLGLANYESDKFSFVKEDGKKMRVKLNNVNYFQIILYCNGYEWKELD